jgi:hypothetical protein
MEVTLINRQSYMAEVSNLLELITDEETRARLIAQMEDAFDIMFDPEDIMDMTSYAKGKEILAKYDVTL